MSIVDINGITQVLIEHFNTFISIFYSILIQSQLHVVVQLQFIPTQNALFRSACEVEISKRLHFAIVWHYCEGGGSGQGHVPPKFVQSAFFMKRALFVQANVAVNTILTPRRCPICEESSMFSLNRNLVKNVHCTLEFENLRKWIMLVILLWVYIYTRQAWKICLATVRIEPTTLGILAQCSASWATRSGRFEYVIFRNWV